MHAQCNSQSPLRAWLFFLPLFHVKMHISCFSTEVTVEIPDVPCCSWFTFHKQKVLILRGDSTCWNRLSCPSPSWLLHPSGWGLEQNPQKALCQTSHKTEDHPTYSSCFDFPLLLGITAENFQHPSPTRHSTKQVSKFHQLDLSTVPKIKVKPSTLEKERLA